MATDNPSLRPFIGIGNGLFFAAVIGLALSVWPMPARADPAPEDLGGQPVSPANEALMRQAQAGDYFRFLRGRFQRDPNQAKVYMKEFTDTLGDLDKFGKEEGKALDAIRKEKEAILADLNNLGGGMSLVFLAGKELNPIKAAQMRKKGWEKFDQGKGIYQIRSPDPDDQGKPLGSILFPPVRVKGEPGGRGRRGNSGDNLISSALVDSGKQDLAAHNPDQALEDFGKAAETDPHNPAVLSGQAVANYDLRNYQEAYGKAREALQANPSDSAAFSVLKLSESRGAGELASAASQAAAQQQGAQGASAPVLPQARPELAMSDVKQGAAAEAVRQAANSLELGDVKAALALADRALEYDSRSGQAYNVRAAVHNQLGQYDAALKDSAAGLLVSPKDAPLLNARTYSLNRMGDYKAALESANEALELAPRSASAHANRAYALRGMGDREGMMTELRDAASLDPRYQASVESALQLPADSDVFFLFPGEGKAAPAAGAKGAPSSFFRGGNPLMLFSGLIGGALFILGLFSWIGPKSREPVAASFKPGHLDPPTGRRPVQSVDEKDTI